MAPEVDRLSANAVLLLSCFAVIPPPPGSTLFPYTTLFRSRRSTITRAGSRGCRRITSNAPSRSQCRSEEHTSELQSPYDLVCRLLLEKKKKNSNNYRLPSSQNTSVCMSIFQQAVSIPNSII